MARVMGGWRCWSRKLLVLEVHLFLYYRSKLDVAFLYVGLNLGLLILRVIASIISARVCRANDIKERTETESATVLH